MKNEDLIYYLGFSYCLGIGPMTFKIIKSHPKGVKGIYEAPEKELLPIFGSKLTEKFVEFRRKFDPKAELEKLSKSGIKVLPVDSEDYPESLKNISDPPICLYLKSSTTKFFSGKPQTAKNLSSSLFTKIYFAIVGTRKPTSYGRQIAYKFSRELAEAGFVIVSGMALGIDTIAHQAALDAGGKTIAILGCGVNIIYPSANFHLYNNIIKSGGAVISEFPPYQTVLKGLFISRNRIISGLSKGVLIAEGGEYSGSLITAKYAGIQGKDVFAIPSPINSEMAPAPNLLIKQGAKMVTTTQDIFDEFEMKITPKKREDIRKGLTETEKLIFDILQKNPQTVDDLAIGLGKTVSEILNTVSIMEINWIIEKNIEKKYQLKL